MNTIYVKTDEELKEAIKKYSKAIKIVDLRPNQKGNDPELERHIDAIQEERIEETGQL